MQIRLRHRFLFGAVRTYCTRQLQQLQQDNNFSATCFDDIVPHIERRIYLTPTPLPAPLRARIKMRNQANATLQRTDPSPAHKIYRQTRGKSWDALPCYNNITYPWWLAYR